MKYIAVFEIPDDKVGLLELTLPTSDGLTVTSPIEFKKAPNPKPKCDGADDSNCFAEYYKGYNRALRDCGVLE